MDQTHPQVGKYLPLKLGGVGRCGLASGGGRDLPAGGVQQRPRRGKTVVLLGLVHGGAHQIDLPPLLHHLADEPIQPGPLVRTDDERLHRHPPRRELVHDTDLQISVDDEGQCPGNGRGRHNQHMGGGPSLSRQSGPLGHAKAVLLVGHDQPQPVKGHPLTEQGMGAHHQVQLPRLQGGVERFAGFPLYRAGQQSHPHPRRGQQRGQRADMLLGQQLGGGHQGGLEAAPGGQPRPMSRRHGLAGAHVPLYQPVHEPPGGRIRRHVLHNPPLGPGEGEGKQRLKFLRGRGGKDGPRLVLPPPAQQSQTARETKELLKAQPPPGQSQGFLVRREVDVSAGVLRGGQMVRLPQSVGQALRELSGTGLHTPGRQPRQQVIGHALGQGVHRHNPPRKAGPAHWFKDGVGHGPPAGRALYLAVEYILLPHSEGIFGIALVEEGNPRRPAVVHHPELHQLQPFAD